MAENSAQTSPEPARVRYSRAFRPLSIWLLVSVVLLAWDFHRNHAPQTTITFNVRVDGKAVNPGEYSATLGTMSLQSGSVVPIGSRTLWVAMPDAEPFQKSLFVWYGENAIGEVDLKWNQGVLDLKIEPQARVVQLTGPHHRFRLADSSGTTVTVPVGSYQVEAVFEHLSEQHQVNVGHNETNRFVLKPNLGTVRLESEPSGARFRVSSAGRNPVSIEGDAPRVLGGLPAGAYTLRMWRGDYVKETPFELQRWETVKVSFAFEYGEVTVLSDPEGATILLADKEIGQTPKTFTGLKPGPYRFRLQKAGYGSVEVSAEVTSTNSITISTNLVNLRYMQGMAAARRELSGSSPDFRKALASVEQALSEKPADAEATVLKSEIEVGLTGQVGREARQAQAAALEARKRAAKQAFHQATSSIPQTELYDAHFWEFRVPLTKVRDALLRTITKTTIKWNLGKEIRVNDETLIFYGTSKGFLSSGKQFVILASQVDSDFVQVHLKFWDYTMATSRAIPAYRGAIDVPLNATFFLPEEAANIEARRREIPENVRSVLQKELQ